ncbi:hypothetical protein D9M69_702860 [compost metagenome]
MIDLMVGSADLTRELHDAIDVEELSEEEREAVARIAKEVRAYWDALAQSAELA